MPFKPPVKRGQKRRIVLEFRGPRKDRALEQLSRAVKALAKKYTLKLAKRKRG